MRILLAAALTAVTAVIPQPNQALAWQPCPASTPTPSGALPLADYECATLAVPLSYTAPGSPRIQIALGRLPAADQRHKLGTIFYNPGGPGNPGRIPPLLTPALHEHFALLGNARLLTLDSFGHGSLSRSQCIDHAVDAYFARLRVPTAGTVCAPNHSPFD